MFQYQVELATEQTLNDEFNSLLKKISYFENRHGISGTGSIEVINEKRKEILLRVGHVTPFKHHGEKWTTHHEEKLILFYSNGQPVWKLSQVLGRSEAAVQAKLDDMKFRSIIKNYDEIISELAETLEEEVNVCKDYVGEVSESIWQQKAIEHLKEKVEKFSNKEEVSTEENSN